MTSQKKEFPKSKICCYCGEEKPIKSFYVNNYLPSGFEPRCKICKNSKKKCRKKGTSGRGYKPEIDAPKLWNVRKQDWVDTYNFLKKIGYDLSSHKSIHQQFCEKYNLEPRKRMYEKSIIYTPDELGLI